MVCPLLRIWRLGVILFFKLWRRKIQFDFYLGLKLGTDSNQLSANLQQQFYFPPIESQETILQTIQLTAAVFNNLAALTCLLSGRSNILVVVVAVLSWRRKWRHHTCHVTGSDDMYVGDTAPPRYPVPSSRSPGRRLQGASPPLSTVPCPVFSVMIDTLWTGYSCPTYTLLKIRLHRQYSLDFATCVPSISRKKEGCTASWEYQIHRQWMLVPGPGVGSCNQEIQFPSMVWTQCVAPSLPAPSSHRIAVW